MGKHARQQIRETVVEHLKSAIPSLTVSASRIMNVSTDDMPHASVYITSENSDLDDLSNRRHSRQATLMIKVYHAGESIDNKLDALSVDIEKEMETDFLSEFAYYWVLEGTTITLFDEGDDYYGVLSLSYEIRFTTENCLPDVIVQH